jgi:chromosome segregation ATPase
VFRFRELSLFGWDYWPPVRVPLDREVVLLSGPNGAGKTTFLDAIRQLLNAHRLSSKRRLQHYLRHPAAPALVKAVVSNEEVRGVGQPFRRERITTPEATLACMLVPSSSGTPEKRFVVLPNRASVEEIRARCLESRDWLPPERYQRILEQAGVTRTLLNVLALEQGKTDSLFEYTPRELLKYVLEMMGDRAVLERYRDARRQYEDTEQEVGRQVRELQAAQARLTAVRRDVTRLDEWEAARDKVLDLEARLPAAQLQEALRERADAAQKIPELRTKVRKDETDVESLGRALDRARTMAIEAAARVEAARGEDGEASQAFGDAAAAHGRAEAEVARLDAAARELAQLEPRDLAALEREADEAARALYSAEESARHEREREAAAHRRLGDLEAGCPIHPEAVDRVLAALEAEAIPATLLAAAVEVDPVFAAAAEAALGDARYALTVAPEHEAAAIALAREHAFPGPVWASVCESAGGAAGPLRLARGAPAWLRDFVAEVRLDPDGSWADARGSWAPRDVTPALGERARAAAIEAARGELDTARSEAARTEAAVAGAMTLHVAAKLAVTAENRRRDLATQVEALPAARVILAEAAERLEAARALQADRKLALEHAIQEDALRRGDAALAERSIGEARRRLEGNKKALAEAEATTAACDEEISRLRGEVSPELRALAGRMELDSPDTVTRDLARARDGLQRLGDKPDDAVREEARHLEANVTEAERHVEARAAEATKARTELSACRERYLEVVQHALHDYRRRAIEIGRDGGVVVEMDLPRLANEDRAIDDAELHARFGFDGKDVAPLGDSSFSGGQRVIAGVILLMATVEGAGRGFFMLDEPFAHLSIDRIDDVGRFFRAAGAQFIITAPTTLDRAQLDPASLVLMLQKKRAQDAHAPVPIVAEA